MNKIVCVLMTFFLVLGLMIFSNAAYALGDAEPAPGSLPIEKLTITNPDGSTHELYVEVAKTPQQQEDGLMYRTHLDADKGMLFVFPGPNQISFWMKNTLVPLDMVFIRADGRVANVHAGAKPLDLTPVPSAGPVVAGLEIKAGQAQVLGLQKGSLIQSASLPAAMPKH